MLNLHCEEINDENFIIKRYNDFVLSDAYWFDGGLER